MKRRILFAGLVSACAVMLAAAGCQDEPASAPVIDGELAMKYAQGNYDLGPRVFRTEGAAKSAEWIEEQAYLMPGMPENSSAMVMLWACSVCVSSLARER